MFQDREGDLWFATRGGGLCHYDGERFRTLDRGDGLADNQVRSIYQDRQGDFWFGTFGGGVSHYDGKVFQTLTRRDGLAGNGVLGILQDRDGNMWFTSYSGGVTRYRPSKASPPAVVIDAVVADRRYERPADLSVPSTVGRIEFEFHAMSIKTRPGAMVYRYRLRGHEDEWQTTNARRVEYQDLLAGDYTFEVEAVDRDLVYSESPAALPLTIRRPYERIAWISALALALALAVFQGVRVVRRDRRLVAANRQIEEASRNKSEFLRRMSHDLRSPMNAIIGFTRLLSRRLADRIDEREARNLANIGTSAGNLLHLINDILDLSRIEAGRIEVYPQPVDLRQLADECADALASIVKPGVELRRELADVPPVTTDPDRLRQVVMNLLGNAVKFTDQGSITVSLRQDGSPVELVVADTGQGIPAEDLPHIFDEFRQVARQGDEQTEGTGLGLAIARKSVELLGGTISAESEVGVGTTFILRIGDYEAADPSP